MIRVVVAIGYCHLWQVNSRLVVMITRLRRRIHCRHVGKRYERVGEDRTRCADVRIVAATNRDLKKWVAAGRFREDLYYRIHVFPILVAPLGERKDDIPLLAKHFVELSVRELRCQSPRLTRAGITALQNYD
jgi:transcriptional regulator with GAF, ATPase, and Fis domain